MNAYLYSQIIKLLYETYFDTKVRKHKPIQHFSKTKSNKLKKKKTKKKNKLKKKKQKKRK